MLRLSKVYRFAAALVALSMSLGIMLPMVQHVCAMEHAVAMEHTPAAAPCEVALGAQASSPSEPCCLVGPVSPHAETRALLSSSPSFTVVLPILSAFLFESNDASPAEHPHPVSPPALTPIALHVLHATFLN